MCFNYLGVGSYRIWVSVNYLFLNVNVLMKKYIINHCKKKNHLEENCPAPKKSIMVRGGGFFFTEDLATLLF